MADETIFLIANLAKEFVPETRAYIRECLEKEGLSAVFSPWLSIINTESIRLLSWSRRIQNV